MMRERCHKKETAIESTYKLAYRSLHSLGCLLRSRTALYGVRGHTYIQMDGQDKTRHSHRGKTGKENKPVVSECY